MCVSPACTEESGKDESHVFFTLIVVPLHTHTYTHTHTHTFTSNFFPLSSQLMNLRVEEIAANRSFVFFWVGSGEGLDQGREVLEWGRALMCAHTYLVHVGCMWWCVQLTTCYHTLRG